VFSRSKDDEKQQVLSNANNRVNRGRERGSYFSSEQEVGGKNQVYPVGECPFKGCPRTKLVEAVIFWVLDESEANPLFVEWKKGERRGKEVSTGAKKEENKDGGVNATSLGGSPNRQKKTTGTGVWGEKGEKA